MESGNTRFPTTTRAPISPRPGPCSTGNWRTTPTGTTTRRSAGYNFAGLSWLPRPAPARSAHLRPGTHRHAPGGRRDLRPGPPGRPPPRPRPARRRGRRPAVRAVAAHGRPAPADLPGQLRRPVGAGRVRLRPLAAPPPGHHVAAGMSFALAVLSKETIGVLLPVLLVAMWQGSHSSTRKFSLAGFFSGFVLTGLFYPLYALLKGRVATRRRPCLAARHAQVPARRARGQRLRLPGRHRRPPAVRGLAHPRPVPARRRVRRRAVRAAGTAPAARRPRCPWCSPWSRSGPADTCRRCTSCRCCPSSRWPSPASSRC
ncbi:hypothetical protein LT493_33665 [Streptomyces tricolor]|nr:hypothetical protein [Streptomyces tricolor]